MAVASRIQINPDRLLADLRELSSFGKLTTGVGRVSYSDVDTESRSWLTRRMTEAGLGASIDSVGNVYGRTPGDQRAVIIGSHTDSVPVGGWLDGALGVIYGLEIARSVVESGLNDRICVEAISFMDEEGTYLPCVGSLSFCEEINCDELAAAKGKSGELLMDAIERCGYEKNPAQHVDPSRHRAYIEAHIEQGPRLEAAGKSIGVVTGIVGIRRLQIEFAGEADHAGTVPMSMRSDAGHAAIVCAAELYERLKSVGGENSVWNIGSIRFEPGADNVVPARSSMVLEIRDLSMDTLDTMESAAKGVIKGVENRTGLPCKIGKTIDIAPSRMDEWLGGHIVDAAKACNADCMTMPSGAGHDAMILARRLPSAMLFIPSINGKSHSEAEDTDEADIVLGCRVLAAAVEKVAAAG